MATNPQGLVFTTSAWTGAEITVVHASGTEAYAVASDTLNAADVATAFRTWLDAGARAWAGSLTSITMTPIVDGGRLAFAYAPVGTSFTSFTGNAAALERIAVCKAADGSGKSGVTRGSVACGVGSVMWDRWDVDGGARNRTASWRMGSPRYSHRRPSVELFMDTAQAWAFGEAVRLASQPRTAYVYDEMIDDYRMVTVGRHELGPHRTDDVTRMAGTLEVLGGV